MLSGKYYPFIAGSLAIIGALILAGMRQASPGWAHYQQSAEVRILTPTLTGKPEMCLTCHQGIEQISESHNAEAFGCVLCHGGDRLSLDLDIVHDSLIGAEGKLANPSDMSTVDVSCGGSECHSGPADLERDHIARAQENLHYTYAGGINLTLDVQGISRGDVFYGLIAARDEDVAHEGAIAELALFNGEAPNYEQFIEKCEGCHAGSTEVIQETNTYRGTGCAACHVYYTPEGLYQGGDENIEGRPAFKKLIEDAEDKKFDALAVIDFDRITRSQKLIDLAIIKDIFRKNRIKVITPSQEYDFMDE